MLALRVSPSGLLFEQRYPIAGSAAHLRVRAALFANPLCQTVSYTWTLRAPEYKTTFRSSGVDTSQAIFNGFITLAYKVVAWESESGHHAEYYFMPRAELHQMVESFRSMGLFR